MLQFKNILRLAAIVTLMSTLSACGLFTRLSHVGDGPKTTEIVNPTKRPDYQPVSMPMPAPKAAHINPNSLWRSGARAFFKDNRANEVGDILTVSIAISDNASINNKTERTRADGETGNLTNLFGFEAGLAKIVSSNVDNASTVSLNTDHTTSGEGKIARDESITMTVAAVITQILPNGNLVINGRQETLVNYELRELNITGIIRREDITSANTIDHTKIAEMRVTYGGRGNVSELQQPRWGMQVLDIIAPF
ncbi:Flagellar L-ring protein [Candidatus Terasakiella magnetica]|uniref:Flagellar L-ring protein n=1 Tax=Candidatus Terasakiella magnetica TaxID=1867952 RepID=A0A1C3RKN6_9PROT|nr:flagellar basal body L-ring protein FlgH [Candidatus Terasakiella magnetica]SCA57882.1 Flagellar L-ring protein [Candidatus Terasakiella magnetica]